MQYSNSWRENYAISMTTISLLVPIRCGGPQLPTPLVVIAVRPFCMTCPYTYLPYTKYVTREKGHICPL